MIDEYYLQDSRGLTGTRMMFWREGGGYTSNLSEAEVFTRQKAYAQNNCRSEDIPWPKPFIDSHSEMSVDCQYLDEDKFEPSTKFYQYQARNWDGNDLYWYKEDGKTVTTNLDDAFIMEVTEPMRAVGQLVPFEIAQKLARPVCKFTKAITSKNAMEHMKSLEFTRYLHESPDL